MQPHKEFRFLLPVVPPLTIYGGHCVDLILSKRAKSKTSVSAFKFYCLLLVVFNVLLMFYFGRVHKSGVIDAVDYIRDKAYKKEVRYYSQKKIIQIFNTD
jgi:hypothetical protein